MSDDPGVTADVAALVMHRARWRCERCHDPVEGHGARRGRIHHVFYRGHVAKRVRHGPWNLVLLHDSCHTFVHASRPAREALERIAVHRLAVYLGPALPDVQVFQKGTAPGALVRAYEEYARRAA